jgi:signal transduction histidine kinase
VTRRIAIYILLTTWVALVLIGFAVYVATRQVLLADLDDAIVARAMQLPVALGMAEPGGVPIGGGGAADGDRFLVRNSVGRTLARPTTSPASAGLTPVVVNHTFSQLADGRRLRTLTIALVRNGGAAAGDDEEAATVVGNGGKPITVTYSGSAAQFDHLLTRLAMCLVITGVSCGVCAAAASLVLSRSALRPLRQTADIIGEIDERRLARRIETAALPPELQPMAQHLNDMLARLESAFEQRRRFLAAASHELRTPVAAMLTTIEVALRRPRGADALLESLRSCLGDAVAMRQLVDRLMEQVRSESTSLNNEQPEAFDVVVTLNDCADAVLRASGDKEVRLVRRLPASPLMMLGEPARLRSIVTNLLANAVEYVPAGGQVEMACETAAVGYVGGNGNGDGEELVVTVSDNGPGISAELLPRLFEPFVRGESPRTQNGHLGLGLSLVQAHARAMGGRCEVVQVVGSRGATFRVYLPRRTSAAVATAADAAQAALAANDTAGAALATAEME